MLVIRPIPATALVLLLWKILIFDTSTFYLESARDIVVAGCIPVFGVIYALLAAGVVTMVFEKYNGVRMSVKNDDWDVYINLYDENLSPFFHVFMTLLALVLIGATAGLEYKSFLTGSLIIGTTTYILSLMYWIIIEIDNPLFGLWHIKSVDLRWLDIDAVGLREMRRSKMRRAGIEYAGGKGMPTPPPEEIVLEEAGDDRPAMVPELEEGYAT